MVDSWKAFLMVLLSVGVVCSAPLEKRSFKIFRGHRITSWDKNPFKFLGMLAGKSICTGSLYDSYTFITAAHCFAHEDAMPAFVALEHTVLSGGVEKSTDIAEYFMLESYKKEEIISGNDVAVVKVTEPVVRPTYDYTTLPLLTKGRPSVGEIVTIVGYGLDTSLPKENGGDSGDLRQGTAKVQVCSSGEYSGKPICVEPQSEFNDQRTESGDSGSPLVYEVKGKVVGAGFLSGISSWSDGSHLIIYSSSSRHREFIKAHAGDN